jgi:hypothetical protein
MTSNNERQRQYKARLKARAAAGDAAVKKLEKVQAKYMVLKKQFDAVMAYRDAHEIADEVKADLMKEKQSCRRRRS